MSLPDIEGLDLQKKSFARVVSYMNLPTLKSDAREQGKGVSRVEGLS